MGQFDWTPDEYLERIRAKIPRYDDLQEQAIAAIPFPPDGSWSWEWGPAKRPGA